MAGTTSTGTTAGDCGGGFRRGSGGLTASVSRSGQPGKLHLGGGLGALLAALFGGLGGALVLSEGRRGETEDEAEADCDGHDFLHF